MYCQHRHIQCFNVLISRIIIDYWKCRGLLATWFIGNLIFHSSKYHFVCILLFRIYDCLIHDWNVTWWYVHFLSPCTLWNVDLKHFCCNNWLGETISHKLFQNCLSHQQNSRQFADGISNNFSCLKIHVHWLKVRGSSYGYDWQKVSIGLGFCAKQSTHDFLKQWWLTGAFSRPRWVILLSQTINSRAFSYRHPSIFRMDFCWLLFNWVLIINFSC